MSVYATYITQEKDDAVRMALKRELQVMSAENRLKRVHVNTHDDDDELPLLYPSDADQVGLILFMLSLSFMFVVFCPIIALPCCTHSKTS